MPTHYRKWVTSVLYYILFDGIFNYPYTCELDQMYIIIVTIVTFVMLP